MLRALRNLLDNAIRHTPSDGSIVVEAGVDDTLPNWAYVAVQDNGGGVPEDELPRIFDVAFQRERARTPGTGAGLGLAIAKGFVEAHRGELRVHNENGGALLHDATACRPAIGVMRVLVTGGAGFVGSHVVDALVDAGHDGSGVGRAARRRARAAEPAWCNERAEYVWGDVTDPSTVDAAVFGVDAVAHQAAMVGLGVDFGDVVAYVHHNDMGTAVLLRALHAAGFRGRFALASSMVVYGEGRYRCEVHGVVAPALRTIAALERGMFEPSCPTLRGDRWCR